MILYPAIDLKDGKCVRLLRGDMQQATVFSDSPAEQALAFQNAGFKWLHVVDLDGAMKGESASGYEIRSILEEVTIPVQLGGGIRNLHTSGEWLEAGVSRVILGTIAHRDPELVREACRQFAGCIAVGIDARQGKVAVEGWARTSEQKALDLAKQLEDAGVSTIIYTDINRDGMMQGANIEETVAFAEALSVPVIASGGITTLKDIETYRSYKSFGIEGVIIGRALYEGTIDPSDALSLVA